MSRFATAIAAIARHEVERRPSCEFAVVVARFDNAAGDAEKAHTVNVRLRESGVVVPNLPVAAAVGGAAGLPRPDDLVLVLFPAGDLSAGVVIGTVYSNERRPPKFGPDDLVLVWPGEADDPDADAVRIRVGKDDAGRHVEIAFGGDKQAQLTIAEGSLTLSAAEASVIVQHSSSSDAKVTIKAGDATLELQQSGDVVLKTSGKLTLDADSVEIKGRSALKVNGQTVEIN